MNTFSFTHKAVDDITQIWKFTFRFWLENQADKYYQILMGSVRDLAKNPELGKKYSIVIEG